MADAARVGRACSDPWAFPRALYTSGITDDDAFAAWSTVANSISEHEQVNMLCQPIRSASLHENYPLPFPSPFEIDDAWLRDTGPTFVCKNGALGGIDWVFNGWGDHTAFDWRNDAKVASHIIELTGATRLASDLVNEGGGIAVNGGGDVLLTETVQLDLLQPKSR